MQHKRHVVVGALTLSLALSGCGGKLPISPESRVRGLGTATPGIERKEAATPAPAVPGETAAPPAPAGEPVAAGEPAAAVTPASPDVAAPPADAAAPAAAAPPAATPTVNPVLANVQFPTANDLEQRWRAMQADRQTFEPHRQYVSPSYQIVWWFDPIFGQILPIGELRGDFEVQATFRLAGQWIEALEVPYHVNQQYDITVPPSILQRMQKAGRGEWADVFIYQTRDIRPK